MKQINKNTKSKLVIIINLVLISVLLVTSVYAWFAINVDNNVKMYDIEVHSDNPLELSFTGEDGTWSSSLDLSQLQRADGTNVLSTMKFIEVTGDGSIFKIPTLIQYDGYALPDTAAATVWKDATPNQDYLSFTVHMRSKDPLNIYVSSTSFAEPASDVITGDTCGNKSTAGAFSKDCIVGAVRVSAFTGATAESSNLKFVWIPRPDLHLKNNPGEATFEMETDLTTGSGTPSGAFEWNDSFVHTYYTVSGNTKTLSSLQDENAALTQLPDSETSPSDKTLVATLSGTTDANGYYTGTATFNVWIEGCDTEARRALANGKFNLAIALDSYSIAE